MSGLPILGAGLGASLPAGSSASGITVTVRNSSSIKINAALEQVRLNIIDPTNTEYRRELAQHGIREIVISHHSTETARISKQKGNKKKENITVVC